MTEGGELVHSGEGGYGGGFEALKVPGLCRGGRVKGIMEQGIGGAKEKGVGDTSEEGFRTLRVVL